jgi:hypothetical protein
VIHVSSVLLLVRMSDAFAGEMVTLAGEMVTLAGEMVTLAVERTLECELNQGNI